MGENEQSLAHKYKKKYMYILRLGLLVKILRTRVIQVKITLNE